MFVVRAKNLIPADSRAQDRAAMRTGPDYTKLDPSIQAHRPTPAANTSVNLRHLINVHVVVVKGTAKGLKGVVKDTIGNKVKVELGNNKKVTFDLDSLKRKE